MARKKHVHKYHLVPFVNGPRSVWACGMPDCNHYMPEHMAHLIPGKSSICFGCGNEFTLTEDSMSRPEPICAKCHLKEKGIDIGKIENIDDLIEMIGRNASVVKE